MRNFKDLIEARGDTAVFTLGRFNPPTTGHEKLIKKMDSVAKKNSAPMYVFPTHSTDPAKNPLPHGLKVAYMKKMYRKYAKNIQISKARNVFEVAKVLYDKGHKAIIMVVGSDRVSEFSNLLDKYNGVESTHGYYGFDNIEVISAGERDPDAEGVSGMSASKMRAAAADGDKDSFLKGIPSGFKDGDKLYSDVRKNMGIREDRDMGDMSDFEQVRDAYLTGKIWNVGDSVTVEGVEGEVVRKGTNYLSYVTEDGKVHKAWLHNIQVDESRMSALDKLRKFDKSRTGKSPIFTDKKGQEFVRMKKKGMMTTMNVPSDEIDKYMKKGYVLAERNYRKEYDNYQGRPEQIANRSSRNKARRIMGDKTKIGMDVGHKDNNPLNNDPKNLRNEDPSKNRREPRLRTELRIDPKTSSEKDIRQQIKYHEKMRDHYSGNARARKAQNDDIKRLQGILKDRGFKEEVNEAMSDIFPFLKKLTTMTHPKGMEKLSKMYAKKAMEPKYKGKPNLAATDVARLTKDVSPREFVRYINKLVAKGVLPKELKAQYQTEQMSFKDFTSAIQEVKQDKDVDDKKGTQPAKYYAGDMAKSTKDKRDAHFKKKKTGPAPGDASAKTKPSTHTKKFKQMYGEQKMDCPPATQDLAINTKNRDATTKKYNYGPLNVDEPGDYWEKVAKHWKTSVEAAKKSLCENCVAFDISPRMKECLPGATSDKDGVLGYCWMHHFKCHSARACHTWAKGGPIDKDKESHNWQERAFGKKEVLSKNATQKDYIDDFEKSDAPQFQGKSKEKRRDMAIAAYLSKNEDYTHYPAQVKKDNLPADGWITGDPPQPIVFDGSDTKSILDKANKSVEKERGLKQKPFVESFQLDEALSMTVKGKGREKYRLGYDQKFTMFGKGYISTGVTKQQVYVAKGPEGERVFSKKEFETLLKKGDIKMVDTGSINQEELQVESFQLNEKITALVNKAKKSGMPYSILKKVYDRGMAAYKTGHRPGATPQQWALARVNSFTTKSSGTWGKADADLAKQVRGEGLEEDPCWDGYKQVGIKKKGNKEVPNCVPEELELNEWGEVTEKDDKSGKELNNPTRGDVKKYKVYVRNDKGNVVKVEFGDPNMSIKRDDPEARKAFRARHNCDQKKDKTTAGYWSCKFWSTKSVTDLMKG